MEIAAIAAAFVPPLAALDRLLAVQARRRQRPDAMITPHGDERA